MPEWLTAQFVIVSIVALVFIGALVALGIYFAAATRDCTKNEDCLSGVVGYSKCFIEHGQTKGKCKECGVNGDCPVDKPYCVAGKCTAEVAADFKCTSDVDCPVTPGSNKCFLATGKCGQCNADAECPQSAPFCVDGKCMVTNCTTSAQCGGDKPYCVDSICAAKCTADSQCATGQKCDGGACKTPCTTASDCSGVNPFCGPDSFCVNTNCAADTDCPADTPKCIKAAATDARGMCKPTPCTPTGMECGNPYSKDGALRCTDGGCLKCSMSEECGVGFSCNNNRCVFDPLTEQAGARWRFYAGAGVTGLVDRVDSRYPQDVEYVIRDLIAKADNDGVDIFRVSAYNGTTGKGKVHFYLQTPLATGIKWSGTKNKYYWNANSGLAAPNGVFITNKRPVPALPPA